MYCSVHTFLAILSCVLIVHAEWSCRFYRCLWCSIHREGKKRAHDVIYDIRVSFYSCPTCTCILILNWMGMLWFCRKRALMLWRREFGSGWRLQSSQRRNGRSGCCTLSKAPDITLTQRSTLYSATLRIWPLDASLSNTGFAQWSARVRAARTARAQRARCTSKPTCRCRMLRPPWASAGATSSSSRSSTRRRPAALAASARASAPSAASRYTTEWSCDSCTCHLTPRISSLVHRPLL